MGKRFEKAKKDIEKLKLQEKDLELQMNKIGIELQKARRDRIQLELDWYGIAGGSTITIDSIGKAVKAMKRWAL